MENIGVVQREGKRARRGDEVEGKERVTRAISEGTGCPAVPGLRNSLLAVIGEGDSAEKFKSKLKKRSHYRDGVSPSLCCIRALQFTPVKVKPLIWRGEG